MDDDHGALEGLEPLTSGECRRLLGQGGVGRLALPGEGAPYLRPVNFVANDGVVVVRTAEGRILDAARRGDRVAFEIDGIDRLEHTGWSVIATGKIAEVAASPEMWALPLRPWASGRRDRFVSISLECVSGRRIGLPRRGS